jgi:ribosomal protein S6--L-glutamate ligase
MPNIGVVGTPGGWSSEWLADAVGKRTGHRLLIDLAKVSLDLGTGTLWFEDVELNKLDALILKKAGARYSPALLDRLELLRAINERGLPMFSKPYSILRVLDRLSCTVTLANGGIPMPPTTITEDVEAALLAAEDYGESVFKPLYSTKARGMMVVSAGPAAREQVEQFHRDFGIMYIQQKLDIGEQDLGVVFLGGEYLTTYARRKTSDTWNTTTRSGGKYQAYEPSAETVELARKAQALFDLDFTCVDVAETANGPLVFEVSAFGGFRGIQTASNMDAAELYIDYVLQKI